MITVTKNITLMPNCGSDRAWVWSVACDFSDEEPKSEMLAIRFANAESKSPLIYSYTFSCC